MSAASPLELVSILVPCRDEEKYISGCLKSILAFTVPKDVTFEVIVLDGLSRDKTRDIVDQIAAADRRIRWVANPGLIQSCALNLGIKEARGSWIMRLDAHTEYPKDYLALCHSTAVRTGAANVGGICITLPGGGSYQAQAVQAITTHRFGVGNSGFRTGAVEGSRDTVPFGFFRREVFEAIGYFDERLVRAQDYEFNRRIKASGRDVWLNPSISCSYYNQPTLAAFYTKQLLREAPYNAYLWYLAPYSFAPRHAVTAVFSLGVLGGVLGGLLTPWILWPFACVMGLYGLMAIASSLQQAVRYRMPAHAVVLPLCFFLYHFIHGLGVLWGLCRLATRTAPVMNQRGPWPGAASYRAWSPVPQR